MKLPYSKLEWVCIALVLTMLLMPFIVRADDLSGTAFSDPRFCGTEVKREPSGKIARDMHEVFKFRAIYPCPATGLVTGACPGWAVDHVIPLACGGCDVIGNMQWLPNEIKNHSGPFPKDRWERKIYCVYGAQ